MLVIPAVDIKGGMCVRLYKGMEDKVYKYFIDPVDAASFWENQGAERLHVVDLDGAFFGKPVVLMLYYNYTKLRQYMNLLGVVVVYFILVGLTTKQR